MIYFEENDRPGFNETPKESLRIYDFGGYKVAIRDVEYINYGIEGDNYHYLIDSMGMQHIIQPGWEHLSILGRG